MRIFWSLIAVLAGGVALSGGLEPSRALAQSETCRLTTTGGGRTVCACQRGSGWRIMPMGQCQGGGGASPYPKTPPRTAPIPRAAPVARSAGAFTAEPGYAWVCYFEYGDRGRAIGKADAIATGRGERYKMTETRVFQRQSGQYAVCGKKVHVKKFERSWKYRRPNWIFKYQKLYSGADFLARVWQSPHAIEVDSGRQQAKINAQARAIAEGVAGAQKYCAENPGACRSKEPDVDHDAETRREMDEMFCRDRGIC